MVFQTKPVGVGLAALACSLIRSYARLRSMATTIGLAFLPTHSANRHNAGCGGAGCRGVLYFVKQWRSSGGTCVLCSPRSGVWLVFPFQSLYWGNTETYQHGLRITRLVSSL